jgi:3-phenylpropionate/cinnamic acid dioxygenase small subunit
MADDLRYSIEDFFYLEAELLDDRRLREWLDLFTDECIIGCRFATICWTGPQR